MKASYAHYTLHFRQPAGTSRGVLTNKETYFLKLEDEDMPGVFGLGECAVFRGLSADDVPAYEDKLRELCANISADKETDLHEFPSIRFGLETAINDFANGCRRQPFPSDFTEGMSAIPINGLVWMGTKEEMLHRIDDKIKAGFTTIKLKVGAIDTESELDLVRHIRKVFPEELERKISHLFTRRFYISSRPSDKWGQELVLKIEGAPLSPADEASLKNSLADILTPHQRPKAIIAIPHFAETSSGKVKRQ